MSPSARIAADANLPSKRSARGAWRRGRKQTLGIACACAGTQYLGIHLWHLRVALDTDGRHAASAGLRAREPSSQACCTLQGVHTTWAKRGATPGRGLGSRSVRLPRGRLQGKSTSVAGARRGQVRTGAAGAAQGSAVQPSSTPLQYPWYDPFRSQFDTRGSKLSQTGRTFQIRTCRYCFCGKIS